MSLVDRLRKEEKTGLYIGGEWRPASDGRTISVVDPSTEEVIAECASASPEDGLAAVSAAADAAAEWAATSPRHRSDVLRRAFDIMIDRSEDYAQLITLENGKTLADSRGEVRYGAEFLRWFSEEAVRNVGDVYRGAGGRQEHRRRAPAGRPVAARDALELPPLDGHAQDRPGPRRRLHNHPQACQ